MGKRNRRSIEELKPANLPENYDLLPPLHPGQIIKFFERENDDYVPAAKRLEDRLDYVVSEGIPNPRRWHELLPGASQTAKVEFYDTTLDEGTVQLMELAYSLVGGQIVNDQARDNVRLVHVAGIYCAQPVEFLESYTTHLREGHEILLMEWKLRLNEPAVETIEIARLEKQKSDSLRAEPLGMQESIQKRIREQGILAARRAPRHERLNKIGERAVQRMMSK